MPSWRMEVGAEKKLENVRFGVIQLCHKKGAQD